MPKFRLQYPRENFRVLGVRSSRRFNQICRQCAHSFGTHHVRPPRPARHAAALAQTIAWSARRSAKSPKMGARGRELIVDTLKQRTRSPQIAPLCRTKSQVACSILAHRTKPQEVRPHARTPRSQQLARSAGPLRSLPLARSTSPGQRARLAAHPSSLLCHTFTLSAAFARDESWTAEQIAFFQLGAPRDKLVDHAKRNGSLLRRTTRGSHSTASTTFANCRPQPRNRPGKPRRLPFESDSPRDRIRAGTTGTTGAILKVAYSEASPAQTGPSCSASGPGPESSRRHPRVTLFRARVVPTRANRPTLLGTQPARAPGPDEHFPSLRITARDYL